MGDYIGRILAEFFKWPRPGRLGMVLMLLGSVARFVFVPLFMMCNVLPANRGLFDVVFYSDTVYIALMFLFAASNGYLTNICMMSAPQASRF